MAGVVLELFFVAGGWGSRMGWGGGGLVFFDMGG